MTTNKHPAEKRIHRRFRLVQNALVVVSAGGIRSNTVLNISCGGMAFCYQANLHPFMDHGTLDLLIHDFVKVSRLSNVQFSTVYDQLNPYEQFNGDREMRLQVIKFEVMSNGQYAQLQNVLKYHATVADNPPNPAMP